MVGTGSHLPPNVVRNDEVANRVGCDPEWIRSRTGVIERRRASIDSATSDLAVAAAEHALKSAGLGAVDALVLATTTPDHPCPATGPSVASRLGLAGIAAFDVSSVCTGFLVGLATGAGLISAGIAETALVIGAETFSSLLNPADRNTCAIFGDGAGAVVLRAGHPDEPGALGPFLLASDGNGTDLITVRAGGSRERLAAQPYPSTDRYFTMAGRQVFWRAVQCMSDACRTVLDRAGWRVEQLDRLVCHQANIRIVRQLAGTLGVPIERCLANIDRVGNTAAASIPIILDEADRAGELVAGDRVLLTAFGGGLSWGAVAMRWPELSNRPIHLHHPDSPPPSGELNEDL